jgi:hypothetical protein
MENKKATLDVLRSSAAKNIFRKLQTFITYRGVSSNTVDRERLKILKGKAISIRVYQWEKFLKRIYMDGQCIRVNGVTNGRGYSSLYIENRNFLTHRFTYMFFVGQIKKGLVIDHKCRIRDCCNPDHLRVVSQRENILAGNGATAYHAKKTHCPKGHQYSFLKNGKGRRCRVCHMAYMKAYHLNNKRKKR